MSATFHKGMTRPRHARQSLSVTIGVIFLLLGGMVVSTMAQVDDATADLNDDGVVNILDLSTLGARFGLQAGQEGYLGILVSSCAPPFTSNSWVISPRGVCICLC